MAVRRVRAQVARNAEGIDRPDLPRNTIEVHATFKDENGFFGLTSYLDYAERQLKQNHAWAQLAQKQHGVTFEFPWEYIDQRPIETMGFLKDQFEFKIDTFKILELLTGHTLYNESGVVLRELVQNSIDAVRLQFSDPERTRSREEGRVSIHWDSAARVLTVSDNGTGMNQEIIKKHLLEVGSSRYQDPKFQEEYPDFSSISRFGIGVLSTFMIADEVEYLTYFQGDEQARRLLLRSVHGKYLVRLLDKNDPRVKRLMPHGTEVRLSLRHTAEMEDPLELAKKWIVVPDCSVTAQLDDGPVEVVGFQTPKEALESVLIKSGFQLTEDTESPIRVQQMEANGVVLAYAIQWSHYFRDWAFLRIPERERPDAKLSADRLFGTCVEGIRVDTDSPGFRERCIYAIANATGKSAPRTNVARSGLEMSREVGGLMRTLYSMYFNHVENEVYELQNKRGFSTTWAAGESAFILASLLRFRRTETGERKQVEIADLRSFAEAAEEAKLVLVEHQDHREVIAPKSILAAEHFWTLDCALFRSMEHLLREVPENVSVRTLAKNLSRSINLPGGLLVSHWDLHDVLGDLIFAKREVGEIHIDERQRRTDLKWMLQGDNPRWVRPLSDWPPASNNVYRILNRRAPYYLRRWDSELRNVRILRPEASIKLEGISDKMVISAFNIDFFVRSPIQIFFSKDNQSLSTEANDLRWVLLSIVCDQVSWIRGPSHAERVFEQLGKEEGLWNNIINNCGEAVAPELSAFRVAATESSWKRFGANLWTRGNLDE